MAPNSRENPAIFARKLSERNIKSLKSIQNKKLFVNIQVKIMLQKNLASEAVVQRCSVKKVFLEISQNTQENTCTRVSFLIKLQASGLQLY